MCYMGSTTVSAAVSESKVSGIIKSLGQLEDDLDSLHSKMGDMKKQITIKTQNEIESLMKKTREMATGEAEIIITKSKAKAEAESKKITDEGDAKLSALKSAVDSNSDDAVRDVVAMILKP